jgi:hypothetical protein
MAAKALMVRIDAPLGLVRSTKATATAASSAEIAAPYTMVDQLSSYASCSGSGSNDVKDHPYCRARTDGLRADQPRPRIEQAVQRHDGHAST